jgi:FG-GAP-like repeat/Secretion system C-terminal sorting domain
MKFYFFYVLSVTCLLTSYAQIEFEFHPISGANYIAEGANEVYPADLDGDGDLDVLTSSFDNKVAWFENLNGQGFYSRLKIISTNNDQASSVFAKDLDQDGDLDVLSTALYSNNVAWYENLDGQGNFGPQQVLLTTGSIALSIDSEDLDGDGDNDVLSGSGGLIAWNENLNGQGNFASPVTISTEVSLPFVVLARDIDSDGDSDIISASFDGKVAWYENLDGQGNFGPQTIITNNTGGYALYVEDIDDDGDMDVVSGSDYNIVWLENLDGQANFGPENFLDTSITRCKKLYVDDLDGDGDKDVLATNSDINGDFSEIVWYANLNGQGDFGSETIISTFLDGSRSVIAGDADNDGDLDVFSASSNDGTVAWYPNTNNVFGSPEYITTSTRTTRFVHTADLDGDGDEDVVSGSWAADKIAWFKNINGQGNFYLEQVVSYDSYLIKTVFTSDLDGDGDLDLLAASVGDDTIAWFENIDGLGSFGPKQVISNTVERAWFVHAGDLDGDGDNDVLAVSYWDLQLIWYENTDGQGTFGPEQIIQTGTGYKSALAEDVDGDGDLDIVTGSQSFGGDLAWHENIDGLGTFGAQQIIADDAQNPEAIFVEDLDSDGDLDVMAAGYNLVSWYENIDGLGDFGEARVISTDVIDGTSVYATDLDLDGDLDVLATSWEDDILAWHENLDGLGNFGPQQIIASDMDGAEWVCASDVDNDGDPDVIAGSYFDDKVVWFENTTILSLDQLNNDTFILYPNPTAGMIKINSQTQLSRVDILSELGQMVLSKTDMDEIDVSGLQSGIYILRIIDVNHKVGIKKLIIE